MAKKKKGIPANYLDKIPFPKSTLLWTKADDGMVTLQVENKGWVNRIAQLLFRRPKMSQVHLDEFGSFVWLLMDGSTSIFDMGKQVEAHFGDKAQPLYPRLARFVQILDSYRFIEFK